MAHRPGRIGATPAEISSSADSTISKVRISLSGCRSITTSSGQRAEASRRRIPRRTPSTRAAAEQAKTSPCSITASGDLRIGTQLTRRGHHRPVRTPDHHLTGGLRDIRLLAGWPAW